MSCGSMNLGGPNNGSFVHYEHIDGPKALMQASIMGSPFPLEMDDPKYTVT